MNYTRSTLWHERSRYQAGVMAVAFSATLIYMQFGMLFGLFSLTSTPIDHAPAEIWLTHPQINSVDLGRPIPLRWQGRLALQPEVVRTEPYFMGIVELEKQGRRPRLCTLLGPRLDEKSLGAPRELSPVMRQLLSEKGSVVVDEAELETLGLTGVGDVADVFGYRVRVVGVLPWGTLRSLAMPYLICSMETAQMLYERQPPSKTMFLLGSCRNPGDARKVVDRLKAEYDDMGTFTSAEFRDWTRLHWLTTSRGGIAAGVGAALALLVGSMIIYQTLYAATIASRREYAVLDALGISRWRMAMAVVWQSFWVGIGGLALALPVTFGLVFLAERANARLLLDAPLLIWGALVTLLFTLLAGLFALRSLRGIDPTQLLR
jgi:putative ABC transport system permease protein